MTFFRDDVLTLAVELKLFYSRQDEAAFFEWLNKIQSVIKYEGRGLNIYLYIDTKKLDEMDLRELLALFYRYDMDLSLLKVFDIDDFSDWFRKRNSYWYKKVFKSNVRA